MYTFNEVVSIYKNSEIFELKNNKANWYIKLRFVYGFTCSVLLAKEVIEYTDKTKIPKEVLEVFKKQYYGETFNN